VGLASEASRGAAPRVLKSAMISSPVAGKNAIYLSRFLIRNDIRPEK